MMTIYIYIIYKYIYIYICFIFFSASGSVPIILKGIDNIIVKRGATFNLTCILTGQAGMEVTWQKNGNPLSTTDVISITNSNMDSTFITSLHFRKITMAENANTFSCTANYPSVTVKASSTAQVTVDGKSQAAFFIS